MNEEQEEKLEEIKRFYQPTILNYEMLKQTEVGKFTLEHIQFLLNLIEELQEDKFFTKALKLTEEGVEGQFDKMVEDLRNENQQLKQQFKEVIDLAKVMRENIQIAEYAQDEEEIEKAINKFDKLLEEIENKGEKDKINANALLKKLSS